MCELKGGSNVPSVTASFGYNMVNRITAAILETQE